MSTKRVAGITIFGVLFVIIVAGSMLLTSFMRRESDVIPLPEASASATERPAPPEQDALNRVEVTPDTIQAVISTLARPQIYSRDILIESYWDGGRVEYDVTVSVAGDMTSLRTLSSAGIEKRIIITQDTLYIWYTGDRTLYSGGLGSSGDGRRTADEWQMMVTYEDILGFDKNDIIDAGRIEYGDEDCVYVVYRSPLLGYIRTYYISINLGLVTGAEEYDETGAPVYMMTAGECAGEVDAALFVLPDGTDLGASDY